MRCHFTPTRMTHIEKEKKATSVGVDTEKSERSGFAGAAIAESSIEGPRKVKNKITVDPAIPCMVHTQRTGRRKFEQIFIYLC